MCVLLSDEGILLTETLKRLNILQFANRKGRNEQLFIITYINHTELESVIYLSYRL